MTHPPIDVRAMSPGLLRDFLAFFDQEAFADNPKWASCYCQCMYVDHSKINWKNRTAHENRAAACERIGNGRMHGLLAYRNGAPVGWCNAAPRRVLDAFADEPDPDAAQLGQIVCFVVAKDHRRSGVATALLQAACTHLKAQGLSTAEASPLKEPSNDAEAHEGPLSMYLAAGFEVHRTDEDGTVYVRRKL